MTSSTMKLYCGTSGFSFKEWKGPFYPEKLPANKMLAYYSERLPTVEINNTFYRMPKRDVLEGWAAQVPDTFRFSIKAPRRITHAKQLAECSEEAGYFFETLEALGPRLGVVLFQLPPHARVDVKKFGAFLGLVPDDVPVAFEFRHPSWRDEAVFAAPARRVVHRRSIEIVESTLCGFRARVRFLQARRRRRRPGLCRAHARLVGGSPAGLPAIAYAHMMRIGNWRC